MGKKIRPVFHKAIGSGTLRLAYGPGFDVERGFHAFAMVSLVETAPARVCGKKGSERVSLKG